MRFERPMTTGTADVHDRSATGSIPSLNRVKTAADLAETFSRDSSISRHSYNSAANFEHQNDQDGHIKRYIDKHPLTELLGDVSWNNIPIVVKDVLKMMS